MVSSVTEEVGREWLDAIGTGLSFGQADDHLFSIQAGCRIARRLSSGAHSRDPLANSSFAVTGGLLDALAE